MHSNNAIHSSIPSIISSVTTLSISLIISLLIIVAASLSGVLPASNADTFDVITGTCGNNGSVTYSYDGNGLLIIDGEGPMDDAAEMPMYEHEWCQDIDLSKVRNIIIGDGVTYIGKYFFEGCAAETVTIGSSVTEIGEGAFYSCTKLQRIDIPDSVKTIGTYSFRYCESMQYVSFGQNVKSIGESAFEGCGILILNLPSTLTEISEHAFARCENILDLSVPANINSIKIAEPDTYGGIFMDSVIASVVFEDGLTNIPAKLFLSAYLRKVSIPDSVTSIGENAMDYWQYSFISEGTELEIQPTIEYSGSRSQFLNISMEYTFLKFFFPGDTYYYSYNTDYENGGDNFYTEVKYDGGQYVKVICAKNDDTDPGEDPLLDSKMGPFTVNDMYGFVNPLITIDKKVFEEYFPDTQAKAIQEYLFKKSDYLCNGMVVTCMASLIFDSPAVSTYGESTLYNVKKDTLSTATGKEALEYIARAHISQYTPYVLYQRSKHQNDLDGLHDAVMDYACGETTAPVLICIKDGAEGEGHILWGLGITSSDSSQTAISVYDCNYPGQERFLYLRKNSGEYISWDYEQSPGITWSGRIGNDDPTLWPVNGDISYDTISSQYFIYRYTNGTGYVTDDQDSYKHNIVLTIDISDCDAETFKNWYDNAVSKSGKGQSLLPMNDLGGISSDSSVALWYEGSDEPLTLEDFPAGAVLRFTSAEDLLSVSLDNPGDISIGGSDRFEDITISFDSESSYTFEYFKPDSHSNQLYKTVLTGHGATKSTIVNYGNTLSVSGVSNLDEHCMYGEADDDWNFINPQRKDCVYGNMDPEEVTDITVEYGDSIDDPDEELTDIVEICDNPASRENSPSKVYTGKPLKASIKLIDENLGGYRLVEGVDYRIEYENNVKVGTAYYHIYGIGDYCGLYSNSFKILPRGTSISKLTRSGRNVKIKWKKQSKQTTGYQIQYSTNKKFKSGVKTVKVKSNKTIKKTIKKLKKKKTYYFRIRTYKKVGSRNYYSSWSKTKKIKIK